MGSQDGRRNQILKILILHIVIYQNLFYCYIYQQQTMNAEQLLNSLNAQSHELHKKKQPIVPQVPYHNSFLKDNQFTSHLYVEEQAQPPEFFTEMLNLQRRKKLLNPQTSDAIAALQKQKQRNAYLAFNEGELAYLGLLNDLSRNKNLSAHNMVTDAMTKRFNKISYQLQNGNVLINRDRVIKTKGQFQLLEQLDVARLLKIKEGNIRSKLDFLNCKMEEMEKIDEPIKSQKDDFSKKVQENLSADYAIHSQKTKIASEYVKHMTQQRKMKNKRQHERKEKLKLSEQKRIQSLKELESVKDEEKRKQIVDRMKERKKKLEEEKKQMNQKQQIVEKFLAPYRKEKPLFKKRSKQYEKKVIESHRYHEEKLKEIKEKKKAYSLNDITDHQKKYSELKKKENEKKKQQHEMYLKSLKINNKQYFRGSIHEVVEEVDRSVKQRDISLYQIGKGKKVRRNEYSKKIREDYKPKIDEQKRKELLDVIEQEQLKKKKMRKHYKKLLDENGEQVGVQAVYEQISPINHKDVGKKYLQFSKLRKKKLEDEYEEEEGKNQTTKILKKDSSIKQKKIDNELWNIRSKQIEEMSNDVNSHKKFEQMKANFENFDEKAAQKEKVLRHAKLSLEEHLEKKNALDNFYLQSIKNKMKLLE